MSFRLKPDALMTHTDSHPIADIALVVAPFAAHGKIDRLRVLQLLEQHRMRKIWLRSSEFFQMPEKVFIATIAMGTQFPSQRQQKTRIFLAELQIIEPSR